MYLFLNSTDAARTLNSSALPDSPVVVEVAKRARRDLLADLAARFASVRQWRIARPRTEPARCAGRQQQLAA